MTDYAKKYGYEFSINDLFHELIEDDSWEPDRAVRERIAYSIFGSVGSRLALRPKEE